MAADIPETMGSVGMSMMGEQQQRGMMHGMQGSASMGAMGGQMYGGMNQQAMGMNGLAGQFGQQRSMSSHIGGSSVGPQMGGPQVPAPGAGPQEWEWLTMSLR